MSTTVTFPGLGLEFTLNRVAFTVFGVEIYWYGIILALGLLAGILIGYWKAARFGIDPDRMTDVILVTTILAVLSSRIYYVLFYPGDYDTLGKILNMRDGGLAIYGAVIGAFVFGWLMCRLRRVPTLAMLDLASLGFLAGQGIGRWGNFVNQEAFGCNTALPWGMISSRTRAYLSTVAGELYEQGVLINPDAPVHPTFLYESLWCLLGLVLLMRYSRRRRFDGEILLLYVAWYGAERCLVEGLRTDSLMWGPLRISQVLAGVSCVAALVIWYFARRRAVRLAAAGAFTLAVQRTQAAAAARTRYEMACARRDAALRSAGEADTSAEKETTDADPTPENTRTDAASPAQKEADTAAGEDADVSSGKDTSAGENPAAENGGEDHA